MDSPLPLRIAVLGLGREDLDRELTALYASWPGAEPAAVEAVGGSTRPATRLSDGGRARLIEWRTLGALERVERGLTHELRGIDGLFVHAATPNDYRWIAPLARALGESHAHFQRSRVPVALRVAHAADPATALDAASPDAMPAIAQHVKLYRLLRGDDDLAAALRGLLADVADRDHELLTTWLVEHPDTLQRARRQIDDYLAAHPDSPHRATLEHEQVAREARRRSRLWRWPLGACGILAVALGVALCIAWWQDRDRFAHAAAFEGDGLDDRWLAIDAYRGYLAHDGWVSAEAQRALARERIRVLALELLGAVDRAPLPSLERFLDLADRTAAEEPDLAARVGELRAQIAARIRWRDIGALLAPLERADADLAQLEATLRRIEDLAGNDELPTALLLRLAALTTRRDDALATEAERAKWTGLLDAVARSEGPAARVRLLEAYVGSGPPAAYERRARDMIRAIEREHVDQQWAEAAEEIAREHVPLEERLALVERFLAAHATWPRIDEARSAARRLEAAWVDADWTRTLAALAATPPPRERVALLLAHARRIEGRPRRHQADLDQRVAAERRAWDDGRYLELKQWFEGDPDAALRIAEGFAGYLAEFPEGRHRAAAEGFVAWWQRMRQPRRYKLEVVALRLIPRVLKAGESEPEPYVVVTSGGQTFRTSVAKGAAVLWTGQVFELEWRPGQAIRVTVMDKDVRWDDELFTVDLTGELAIARTRARVVHATGHAVQLKTDVDWPELP